MVEGRGRRMLGRTLPLSGVVVPSPPTPLSVRGVAVGVRATVSAGAAVRVSVGVRVWQGVGRAQPASVVAVAALAASVVAALAASVVAALGVGMGVGMPVRSILTPFSVDGTPTR